MSEAVNYLPKVRKQYEEFPYPERNPAEEVNRFYATYGSRLDAVNHACFRGKQDFNNFRVLVAGGGTGDSTISWAEQLREKENCEVIYLDMSSASLNIAKKRAEVRKLTNIKWINDSLLNIPNLGIGQFDFIDCTGVLHHLKDPDAGLKALQSALKPSGAMNLMVYAPYGRMGIYMIQNLMRLVNGDEEDPRLKIKYTKKIIECLPLYHIYTISKQLKIQTYNDADNDSGLYDLFLHSQDRAYSILEVHDWLEKCALRINGEPGNCYLQVEYLPETHIKDKEILNITKGYPLKIQQAIAESMSNRISKHEFFVVHKDAGESDAKLTDKDMVLCPGMTRLVSFQDLSALSTQHKDSFTITMGEKGNESNIFVPKGKFIQHLLRNIDGKRTVQEVLEAVKNGLGYDKSDKNNEAILMNDLEDLFKSLNRGHVLFLRDKSIPPFKTTQEIQDNLVRMK